MSRPQRGALAVGLLGVVVVSVALAPLRGDIVSATPALCLVVPIVLTGIIGTRTAAVITAVVASLAFNVVFLPPRGTVKIHAADDAVALAVFVLVALTVGTLVSRERQRRQAAEERATEMEALNQELRVIEEDRQRLAEEATRAVVLERVDQQRSALLRSVSHDLRTPLATIRAVSSDLLSAVPYDDSTRRELLSLVSDEAERLDRLVANLLSLSRIEAGALNPDRQAVALDELVDYTLKRLGSVFRQRRVQVDLPADLPLVDGDFTQVELVLTNLLENAARHAPMTTTVRVGGRAVGEFVEVWVDDEGLGIPPFERKPIFEPFRRGEGSTSSGVGLAICKAIVEAHGGEISAEVAPGGGARFRFTLPQRRERQA